jgi:DNA-binding NarL/FixJ family response regulator
MPDMDGLELLRAIRGSNHKTKVVAVSGFLDGSMLRAAQHLGADGAMTKPFTADQVLSEVRRVL